MTTVFVSGCASDSGQKPVPTAGTAAKPAGRWVSLPPQTGSNIPRRVWVDENGMVRDPKTGTQVYSAEAFEEMQRRTRQGSRSSGGSN